MPAQLPDDRRHGIRAEVVASILAEPVHGLDEPDRADLDEVVDRFERAGEATGERMDEGQVLLDHPRARPMVASAVVRRQQGGGRSAPRTPDVSPPIGHVIDRSFRSKTYSEMNLVSMTDRGKRV
jgi:hypothetical protein